MTNDHRDKTEPLSIDEMVIDLSYTSKLLHKEQYTRHRNDGESVTVCGTKVIYRF